MTARRILTGTVTLVVLVLLAATPAFPCIWGSGYYYSDGRWTQCKNAGPDGDYTFEANCQTCAEPVCMWIRYDEPQGGDYYCHTSTVLTHLGHDIEVTAYWLGDSEHDDAHTVLENFVGQRIWDPYFPQKSSWNRIGTPSTDSPGVVDSPTPQRIRIACSPNPNPCYGRTSVHFSLPGEDRVRLDIYDLSGRLVRSLLDGPARPGDHMVDWPGINSRGEPVPAGIYFLMLRTAGGHEAREQLVLVR